MCVVSSSLCYYCCYQPLMFYQLFINFLSNFYQLFINFLSTFYQLFNQLVYQLFINLFINFFINFLINLFYQLFINYLSTVHQLFLSTFYQVFINLEEMITFDICETLFALLPGHTMFLVLPAVAGPESQHTLSWCPCVSSHALLDEMLLVN